MGIRGLFSILISVFIFFNISRLFKNQDTLGYILAGIFVGWGADYFIKFVIENSKDKISKEKAKGKALDSSAIIDGRILDIIETGFVEGDIIVPKFVLAELQLLADSEDSIKRERGRRGLDLINLLQNKNNVNKVVVVEHDYKVREVDAKLVKLAKDFSYDIITTDFNLNKVATIQGVKVLNINTLSNALKPIVIPNEELDIELIKQGDRDGQAVGYLNDGTMVVAEDGGDMLGKKIRLLVTSVYPTAAGRMIFGRVKRK